MIFLFEGVIHLFTPEVLRVMVARLAPMNPFAIIVVWRVAVCDVEPKGVGNLDSKSHDSDGHTRRVRGGSAVPKLSVFIVSPALNRAAAE